MKRICSYTITLLWVALTVLALSNTSADTLQFLDDQAFLMGSAEAVRSGELLLSGLPSHLGARHLGPYYVYLQAILSWLAGSDPVVVSLLFTSLKLSAPLVVVLALALTAKGTGRGNVAGGFVMLASLSSYTVGILRMDWINYFLIIVSSLLTLAIVRVVTRGATALPFFLLASTLLIQLHLSPLPSLAAACGGVVLYLFWCREKGKTCSSLEKFTCVLATVVLWLPVFAYEVLYQQNIFAILGRNIGKRPAGASFWEIPRVFFEFTADLITGRGGTLSQPFIAASIGVCIVLLVHRMRRCGRSECVCIGIALLQCGAMLVALTQVKPPVLHYYLISLYGPLLYLWGLAALEASEVIYDGIRKGFSSIGIPMQTVAVIALGSFFYVWTGNLSHLPESAHDRLGQPYHSLAHARDVGRIIRTDCGDSTRVKIVTRGGARLSANAYYYHVSPELLPEFMYAGRMVELPIIRKGVAPYEHGYLIDCGIDTPPQIPLLGKRLEREWALGGEVSLASCESCGRCRMWRLVVNGVR
jgi:hypothetical protein